MNRFLRIVTVSFGVACIAIGQPRAVGQGLNGYDDVKALLAGPDAPRTVEAFLAAAAQMNPELFSRFTLMRDSQSLQSANPAAPRAIVFGSDARLVLTFNGYGDQDRFNTIEMMQFVPSGVSGGRFELREIEFDPAGKKLPVLSAANPAICARCHGTDPKPLWEEYDRWPGAFGEDDDALIDFDEPGRYSTTDDRDNKIVARHRLHLKEFKNFIASKDKHPRYKWLIIPGDTGSPVAPYIPRGRSGQYPLRPNLNLTKHFSELNAQRVAGKLSDNGQACFQAGAPLAAALMLDCDRIEGVSAGVRKAISLLNQEQSRGEPARPGALPFVPWSLRNPSFYNDGRTLLLETMGISDFDWNPSRIKRQWQYFQGFKDTSDDILAAVWPKLTEMSGLKLPPYDKIRAELNPQYYRYDDPVNDEDVPGDLVRAPQTGREQACVSLAKTFENFSVDALRQACEATPKNGDAIPPVVEMCMSCHDGTSPAPVLPLDQRDAIVANPSLRDWIFERVNATDESLRMPPTRPLTVAEYRQLVQFYARD